MLGGFLALISAVSFAWSNATVRRGVLSGTVLQAVGISLPIALPVFVVAMLVSALGEIARSGASAPGAFLCWSAVALAGMGVGNVLLPPLVKRYFPDRIGLVTAVYSTALAVSTMVPALLAVPVARAVG